MAIFRKTSKFWQKRKRNNNYDTSLVPNSGGFYEPPKRSEKHSTPLVPNSGGFYDSSIRGKTYEEYLESPENRSVAGIRVTQLEQSGPRLVKKLTPSNNTGNK